MFLSLIRPLNVLVVCCYKKKGPHFLRFHQRCIRTSSCGSPGLPEELPWSSSVERGTQSSPTRIVPHVHKTCIAIHSRPDLLETHLEMKFAVILCLAFLGYAAGAPRARPQQKEGAFFTNEAIRQAQNTHLIPQGATIQKVQEGVELAAYESIPGDQRINLYEILGEHVPPEVVNNLQAQVDQVGKN